MKTFAVFVLLCLLVSVSSAQFKVGDVVKVSTDAEDCLNARNTPAIPSTILKCEDVGTTGTVIAGPIQANGYTWYQVRYADGIVGWSAGELLELVSAPPVYLPPTGSLSVSRIVNGYLTAWYTMRGDSLARLAGYDRTGLVTGWVSVPASKDTAITLELWGPGGSAKYTAWTVSGSTPPASPDSAKIAQENFTAGFALARAKFDSVYLAGRSSVVCPPVDSLAARLRQVLELFLARELK